MSAEPNEPKKRDTEAPTSAITETNLNNKISTIAITDKIGDFIVLISMHWGRTGDFLGKELALEEYAVDPKEYERLMKLDVVKEGLQTYGVRIPKEYEDIDTWRSNSLTPLQLLVANTLLDLTDTRSNKKKLQDYGVSTGQYQGWLRDPVFANYMKDSSEGLLRKSQHEAHLALLDKIAQGDLASIKYYNELNGYFTPSADRGAANVQGSRAIDDLRGVMIEMIEIIAEEVDDPAIAARIADRFKTMMTARHIVDSVMAPPVGPTDSVIKIPTVAKTRSPSAEMEKVLNSGVQDQPQF